MIIQTLCINILRMIAKIRSYDFLTRVFPEIPNDVLYYISTFSGKYIHLPKIQQDVYKTKIRKKKHFTKHLIMKTKYRSWSI